MLEKFQQCKTVEDLLEEFPDFIVQGSAIVCQICKPDGISDSPSSGSHGILVLPEPCDSATNISDPIRNFRNLKIKNDAHYSTDMHNSVAQAFTEENKVTKINITRDQKVGETLGMLIYDITKTAKPDWVYKDQMSLLSMLNIDVGELKYSRISPAKFIPYLAETIDNQKK